MLLPLSMDSSDRRQYAPATQRNRDPILAVLQQVLPPTGTVLEISSGTGEHAVYFAPVLAPRLWIPTDPDPIALESIAAWRQEMPAANLVAPIYLDVHDSFWPVEQTPLPTALQSLDVERFPIQAIVNINMIHIAPWSACLGLMAGAGRILPIGGILFLYGPFKQTGRHTSPSNADFDQHLQQQNPAWGVRNVEEVIAVATSHRLTLQQIYPMPANNLSLVFQR
jgi:hypothetical protein